MNLEDIKKLLNDNPMFWSRLGFALDPIELDEENRPKLIADDMEYLSHTHTQMYNEGVKIFTTIMTSGWIGDNKYDYTLVDKCLEELLEDKPDAYYMPRVKLNVPVDWCASHPDDVFVYENGPVSGDEIKKLVGTTKQDYYGMESPHGYPVAGPSKGDRPNLNGVIGLQSYTSKKWLEDAAKALRRFIRHIEGTKYAKQVIGYQIGFGTFGENVWWGCWNGHDLGFNWSKSRRLGDFSTNAQKAFWNWGIGKYKTEAELKKNWGENISETACVPNVAHRLDETDDIKEFFRGYEKDKICCDYEEFLSDIITDDVCYFASVVKGEVPQKAVGTFYGYIIGIGNSSYSGHTMIDKLLNCKDIDFIAAPKGYYRSGAQDPGLEQAPMQSVTRKKLWIDELDNHTHKDPYEFDGKAKNFAETKKILWREYTKNLVFDQGVWWMDLGIGWFDDFDILKEINTICKFNKKMRNTSQSEFKREVLLVVDDAVLRHKKLSYGISNFMVKSFASDIKMCGVPVDLYRLKDLAEIDLSSYKVAVFLNTFEITDENKRIIETKFSSDTVFIWNYAAGIINKEVDFANTKELTGFKLANIKLEASEANDYARKITIDFPTLAIENECKALYSYKNGACMIGEVTHKGRRSILCTLPFLTINDIYEIIKSAKCHLYAPKNTCVYADSRVIGIFSGDNAEGIVNLGKKARNVISNEIIEKETHVKMNGKDFAVYVFD